MPRVCFNCSENYPDDLRRCPKCDFAHFDDIAQSRKELEYVKGHICPTCKRLFSIKDYADSLSTVQQMYKGASARTSGRNAVDGGISMAKHLFSFFSGEARKDAEQSICTNCKHFCVRCPYCEVLNPMSGKISYEFQPTTCKSCGKEFDVFIFNA